MQSTTAVSSLLPGQLFVTGPGDNLYSFVRLKDNHMAQCRDVVGDKHVSFPEDRECLRAKASDLARASARMYDATIFHPSHSEVGV